jgi:hypothetical protein
MHFLVVFGLFLVYNSQPTANLPGPWLEVLQWVNRAGENCPSMATTGVRDLKDFDTGFAYNTANITYRKRFEEAAAPDCTFLAGYGINSFKTQIVPKVGYTFGISYNATTVTVTEYNNTGCVAPAVASMTRPLNTCLQETEDGTALSRWFQFTAQEPPGYTPIGQDGPPNEFRLQFFTAGVEGCGTRVKNDAYPNVQNCQKLHDNLYIKGYCGSSSSFTGCVSPDSDCNAASCVAFADVQAGQCINDFTGFGQGGNTFAVPVTKIYVTCSGYTLSSGFLGLFVVVLALLF